MKKLSILVALVIVLGLGVGNVFAQNYSLYEMTINNNGTIADNYYPYSYPPAVPPNTPALGTYTYDLGAGNNQYFGAFFDVILDPANGVDNYWGASSVPNLSLSASNGWSWEIGDAFLSPIWPNLTGAPPTLDNTNESPETNPGDVGLALAWNDIDVPVGEQAVITLTLGTTQPTGDYLEEFDSLNAPPVDPLYYSGNLSLEPVGTTPEPCTLALMGSGALLLLRRWRQNR